MPEIKIDRAERGDAFEIFQVVQQCRDYLREWLPWIDGTRSPEDTLSFIADNVNKNLFNGREIYVIRINKKIVGMIDLQNGDKFNNKAEIGYWLAEEHQGKGIITEACRRIINKVFNDYGINRMTIKAAVGNLKSRHIPERLGFVMEGVERSGEFLNGRYVDLVVYSMLKDEWMKKNSNE